MNRYQDSLFIYQAAGEKAGKTLSTQLSDLNKKISEVNLQVKFFFIYDFNIMTVLK